jgi:hypothetical protein
VQRLLSCCFVMAALLLAECGWASPADAGGPAGTFRGCPSSVLPLPGSAAAYAPVVRNVVLGFVHTGFAQMSRTPKKLVGASTGRVLLVRNWLPSGWIKTECGQIVWQNSIAVGVYFPAMDLPHNPIGHCNACDRITFLASETTRGWTVWGDY